MAFVTYVDVNSLFVRGKIKDGNNKELLIIEAADTDEEKVVLVFNGSMASSLRQMVNRHVPEDQGDTNIEDPPEEAEIIPAGALQQPQENDICLSEAESSALG